MEAQEDHDIIDEVFEGRVHSAVGSLVGPEASSSIESLLGARNDRSEVSRALAAPGDTCVVIKFDPNESTVEENDTIEPHLEQESTEEDKELKD